MTRASAKQLAGLAHAIELRDPTLAVDASAGTGWRRPRADATVAGPARRGRGVRAMGQVVLSRELDRRRVDPPIDVLPSLSRLGSAGIGAGGTRELAFAEDAERHFVDQAGSRRTFAQTLDLAWKPLARFPETDLNRIKPELVERHSAEPSTEDGAER